VTNDQPDPALTAYRAEITAIAKSAGHPEAIDASCAWSLARIAFLLERGQAVACASVDAAGVRFATHGPPALLAAIQAAQTQPEDPENDR